MRWETIEFTELDENRKPIYYKLLEGSISDKATLKDAAKAFQKIWKEIKEFGNFLITTYKGIRFIKGNNIVIKEV